jgi:neutral amino acid transport system permease protein
MSQDVALTSRIGWIGGLERVAEVVRNRPVHVLVALLAAIALALGLLEGWRDFAQATINGVVAGNYFALGAVGLTLVFGVLRLVNFAHGEFLTFGAYAMIAANALHVPLVVSAGIAVVATAILGIVLEVSLWRPVRRKRVGELQLLLLALGLAFFMRNAIAFVAGPEDRQTGADVTTAVRVGELLVGRTELIVTALGVAVIVLVALALRSTSLGRQTRALADNIQLAETTGIDTDRIVLLTWAISGGLAGLAGVFYALPAGTANPNIGFSLVLSIFAAVVLGGIGNAYGALAGGMLIGLVQEWSTLVIEPQMKVAVGFAVLILVLLVRPQGLFGQARSVEQ